MSDRQYQGDKRQWQQQPEAAAGQEQPQSQQSPAQQGQANYQNPAQSSYPPQVNYQDPAQGSYQEQANYQNPAQGSYRQQANYQNSAQGSHHQQANYQNPAQGSYHQQANYQNPAQGSHHQQANYQNPAQGSYHQQGQAQVPESTHLLNDPQRPGGPSSPSRVMFQRMAAPGQQPSANVPSVPQHSSVVARPHHPDPSAPMARQPQQPAAAYVPPPAVPPPPSTMGRTVPPPPGVSPAGLGQRQHPSGQRQQHISGELRQQHISGEVRQQHISGEQRQQHVSGEQQYANQQSVYGSGQQPVVSLGQQPQATGHPYHHTSEMAGGYNASDGAVRVSLPGPGECLNDRYTVISEIGVGGFGAVYEAHQTGLERSVALKVLLPQAAAIEGAAERFKREAMLAKELRHPNTIQLFDYGQTHDGLTFIAMELLEGKTLEQEVIDDGRIAVERTRRIASQVLKSLAEAHDRGIVHRDLKPSNIMLVEVFGERDFVKVLDFGIARALDSGQDDYKTRVGTVIGTPQYMAPEQLKGEDVGATADIYAMGLLMAEMLSGKAVYGDDNTNMVIVAQLSKDNVPLADVVTKGKLGNVVFKATRKSPADRYQNVAEMLDALENPGLAPSSQSTQRHLAETVSVRTAGKGGGGAMTAAKPGMVIGGHYGAPPTAEALAELRRKHRKKKSSALPLLLLLLVVLIGCAAAIAVVIAKKNRGAEEASEAAATANQDAAPTPEVQEPTAPPPDPIHQAAVAGAVREGSVTATQIFRRASAIVLELNNSTGENNGLVHLILVSEPSGADVYRGEDMIGRTPFNREIPAGEEAEELRLRRRGHEDTTVTVNLTELAMPDTVHLPRRHRTERTASSPEPEPAPPEPERTDDESESTDEDGSTAAVDEGTPVEEVEPVRDILLIDGPAPTPDPPADETEGDEESNAEPREEVEEPEQSEEEAAREAEERRERRRLRREREEQEALEREENERSIPTF